MEPTQTPTRTRLRRLLMCRPTYFDVVYRINPWMHPEEPADADRASRQWDGLRTAYEQAGHVVETIEPAPGLPDMVFAANSAVVVDGIAFCARFRHVERRGEEPLYERWFAQHGFRVVRARHVHEGEGDFAAVGDVILAGTGFRTDVAAHREAERLFEREVVSLTLVDERFYHLDTALFVLDDTQIGYYPGAFAPDSQRELARRYPDAVLVDERDAIAFGCNATSDGSNVYLPAGADRLATQLRDHGFDVIPIALPELRKSGGSVKCCTLELRDAEGGGK